MHEIEIFTKASHLGLVGPFLTFFETYSMVPHSPQIEGLNFCRHLIQPGFLCNEVRKNAFSDRLACEIQLGNDCNQIGESEDASKVHAALHQTSQVPDNCKSCIFVLGLKV